MEYDCITKDEYEAARKAEAKKAKVIVTPHVPKKEKMG